MLGRSVGSLLATPGNSIPNADHPVFHNFCGSDGATGCRACTYGGFSFAVGAIVVSDFVGWDFRPGFIFSGNGPKGAGP